MELKKEFCKNSHKHKKHCANDLESNDDSDYGTQSHGSDSTGELDTCKKCKENDLVQNYTYPSSIKAIPPTIWFK